MNQENPETKEQVENKEVEQTEIDDGLQIALKLQNGEMQMEDLTPEQHQEFHDRFVVEQEELPEGEQKEESEVKEEKIPEKKDEPEPVKDDSLKKKYYEKSNELNRVQQLLANSEKRRKELEALKVETKKVKYEDPLSDDAIKSRDDRLEAIERRQNQVLEIESKNAAAEVENLKREALYLGIGNFQNTSSESDIKTSKSFQVLDAAYAKFQNDIGGPENRQKYLEDAEFRRQKEAEGYVFPMDDKDWNAYQKVVLVHRFKEDNGYPTYSSAYADWKLQNGIVSDQVKDAVLKTAQSITQKVSGNSGSAVVLDPETGKSHQKDEDGMTNEWMEDWLTKHPYPSTPQEVLTQKKIMEKIKRQE